MLDLHALAFAEPASERELLARRIDADGVRALLGERDRGLSATAAELEHALPPKVAEQPELRLGRDVGPVLGDVGRETNRSLVRG